MTKDMIEATAVITQRKHPKEFKEYGKIYPFTTENIKGYAKEANGKDILTIVGSGDHYLNFLTEDAKSIDTFDINKLTIHYLKLKKALIENQGYEEFFAFFQDTSGEKYKEFRDALKPEERKFWDYIYLYFIDHCKIAQMPLFYPMDNFQSYYKRNNYFHEKEYKKLQEKLKKHSINFLHSDINDIDRKLLKKYDAIFCSNIYLYQDIEQYAEKIKILQNALKENGKIYYAYLYNGEEKAYKQFLKLFPETQEVEVEKVIEEKPGKDKVLFIKKSETN